MCARAHAHTWCFSHIASVGHSSFAFAVVCRCNLSVCGERAGLRTRGDFHTCSAAASTLSCGAPPGPLLGFSWAYPESSWASEGPFGAFLALSWASPGFLRLVTITKEVVLCRKLQHQSRYVYKGLVSYCKIQHQTHLLDARYHTLI